MKVRITLPDLYLARLAYLEDYFDVDGLIATMVCDVYVNICGHITKGELCYDCRKE